MLTWLVLSTVAINVGYLWSHDQGGGTTPDPINTGTAEIGGCQQQWTTVWHCEMVNETWGEGRTPRSTIVHAGRDLSGRTVDVVWRRYSTGDSVVVATGVDAPLGDAAIFVYTPLAAAFCVAVAAALVMIGRVLDWIGRLRGRAAPPATDPAPSGSQPADR